MNKNKNGLYLTLPAASLSISELLQSTLNSGLKITPFTFAQFQTGIEASMYSLRELHGSFQQNFLDALTVKEQEMVKNNHQAMYLLEEESYKEFTTYITAQTTSWRREYSNALAQISQNIDRKSKKSFGE